MNLQNWQCDIQGKYLLLINNKYIMDSDNYESESDNDNKEFIIDDDNNEIIKIVYNNVIQKFKDGNMILYSPNIFSSLNLEIFTQWIEQLQ